MAENKGQQPDAGKPSGRGRSGRARSGTRSVSGLLIALAVWWLWMPAALTVVWLLSRFVFGGFGQQAQGFVESLQADAFPYGDPWHLAALMWVWLAIGGLVSLIIIRSCASDGDFGARPQARRTATALLLVGLLLTVTAGIGAWAALWDNDKALADYYLQDTTFVTASVSPPPSSLIPLVEGDRAGTGGCTYVGAADVPSCLRIGTMPAFDWAPRTASFAAAGSVMTNSSALASQVNVMAATEHYLPGTGSSPGVWSAVLDGARTRPMEGVAEWDGQSNAATICQFQGDDSFNRAFSGTGGNSLGNLIAQLYPSLVYTTADITGYCTGSGSTARPVLVLPVERQIGWKQRSVLEPAGVLVLTGSPSGNPVLTYHATVEPGRFPCQVYPESVAKTQVDDLVWSAGRGNMDDAGFGYENASIASNSANSGQYVMRSNLDGHYYFVTPLTPRNSASQAVVAYAVERADEASTGLNPLTVYVVADSTDPPSLQVIESEMTGYVNRVDPGLLGSGGSGDLDEILPFGQGMWRGFVDVDGVTQDYVDVSSDSTQAPSLVQLSDLGSGPASGSGTASGSGSGTGSSTASGSGGSGGSGTGTGQGQNSGSGTLDCGGNPATMSPSRLAQCIQEFAAALNQQESTATPIPSMSPSSIPTAKSG